MRALGKIHIKRWITALLCLFLILSDFVIADASDVSAPEQPAVERVKAGIFYFDGYHVKDEEGNLSGYGIELLQMISRYSHLNFEYVGYDASWNDMLTMLENGEIDVVTSARKNPEREDKFAFSYPVGRNSTVISVLANNTKFHSGDYKSYDGMCIGPLTPTPIIIRSKSSSPRARISAWPAVKGRNEPGKRAMRREAESSVVDV